jgi:hypothetical protein
MFEFSLSFRNNSVNFKFVCDIPENEFRPFTETEGKNYVAFPHTMH